MDVVRSTPLGRIARQLQAALPRNWRVEVADAGNPTLRVEPALHAI